MDNFSVVGLIIFIAGVALVVFAVKKALEPKRKLKQENERLKRELNKYKNS